MRIKSKVIQLTPPFNEQAMEDALDPYLNDGWELREIVAIGGMTFAFLTKVLSR